MSTYSDGTRTVVWTSSIVSSNAIFTAPFWPIHPVLE